MAFDWTENFLKALCATPNVTAACDTAGVSRQAAYEHRKNDPLFAAAWDDAIEQSTDSLVGEAYRRAKDGTEKPVFHQGEQCGTVREYSDTLMIFLLKAHRRDVYGDRHDVTSGGKPIGSLPTALANLSDNDLAVLESLGQKLVGGPGGDAPGGPG